MFSRLEVYIVEVIREERKGALPCLLKSFLYIFSVVYGAAIFLRNKLFDLNWLKVFRPPLPVISVGNIVAGGTGKTPTVLLLAEALSERFRVAVLSRGYRSGVGKGPCIVGETSQNVGDEPTLLKDNLAQATVIVGSNRAESSLLAKEMGADIVLLDDGMQHRQLARDLEVVVVDGKDPFGRGKLLPAGFLRESPAAFKRADLIVANHSKGISLPDFFAPVVKVEMKAQAFFDLATGKTVSLKGKKVGVFCGIAHPARFVETLQQEGIEVIETLSFADHKKPDVKSIKKFSDRCRDSGAEALICTEKDKIKILDLPSLPLPILWTKASLAILDEESQVNWDAFLDKVVKLL